MKGTMKQAWLMNKGGPWELKDVPIPKPGPNQLLVKTTVSSICNQTDLNTIRALHPPHDHQCRLMFPHHFRQWDKRLPDVLSDVYPAETYPFEPFPTTMGHEGTGIVVGIGDYIKTEDRILGDAIDFQVGDRVVGIPVVGGFGEYFLLDRGMTVPVPDSMTDEDATLVEPVFMVYNVVRQVISIGDTVAILGQGSLGLIATQIAKHMGASLIIVSELEPEKRTLALEYGADYAIDPKEKNAVHEIERITKGRGVDVGIEAAGEPETTRILPYIMAMGGKIGQIGACCVPVTIDWSYLHFKGLKVTSEVHMLYRSLPRQVLEYSIRLITSGMVNLKKMVTHRYQLDQINEAFKAVESGKVIKALFVFEKQSI